MTCLSTGIVPLLASRGVPSVYTLHDYWLLCHRGQLLDVHDRLCAGPEPGGCSACVNGPTADVVPLGAAPLVRAIERRLPGALRKGVHHATAHVASRRAVRRRGQDAASRRLEHMRAVCSGITRFLAPSRSIRQRFIAFGIDEARVALSQYGFDRGSFGAGHSSRAGPLRLGFVGTLMLSKAPHLLLEAHRDLPAGAATVEIFGAHADYHGDASYRGRLEPLLAGAGVRVHGSRPHEHMADVFSSLDVLVVTSIWPETSPLVIWEALLSGVPVIASRIGGIPEIVEHGGNGLLVEPGSVESLCRTLQRLLDEPGLFAGLRAGAAATSVRGLEDDVRATRDSYRACIAEQEAAQASPTRLAAVVLNHRTGDDTVLAISSLLASKRRPDDIILVDNDVADECRQRAARWGSAVRYLHTGRNLGFSGGMNVGIRAALESGAGLVALVNSDVVVSPSALAQLEAAIAKSGHIGIAGPLVLSRAEPDIVASAGIAYDARTGRMRNRAFGERVGGHSFVDDEPDAVNGCLMLISRSVFDRIGLFDERYFFGFEDIDFCLRARTAGVAVQLVPHAVVYHEGGRSIGQASTRRLYFAARNHLLMASAHGENDSWLMRGVRMASIASLNLAHAATDRGGSLPGRLSATLRGIRDYLSGRSGGDLRP